MDKIRFLTQLLSECDEFEFDFSAYIAKDDSSSEILLRVLKSEDLGGHQLSVVFFNKNGYENDSAFCQMSSMFWGKGLYQRLEKTVGDSYSYFSQPTSSGFFIDFDKDATYEDIWNEYVILKKIIIKFIKKELKFKEFTLVE